MRFTSVLVLASIILPATAQSGPEIRAVTLSTAGLAMIEADGRLDADGLRLPIRRTDIDDFLKSLRLSDPTAGVPMLTLPGPNAVQDLFSTLPFDPDALGNLEALLDAMIGAPVFVERPARSISGALMGTRNVPCANEGQQGCIALTLRDEGGTLHQIELDDTTELTFADAADSTAIERGLAALRGFARAQMLDVHLTSTDPTPRDIGLGWLQPAPVWKTAWRAESGPDGLTLTGWAVFENTTGQDWTDITLTLATGAVQALDAQLYDRLSPVRRLASAPDADMVQDARSMDFTPQMEAAPVTIDDGDSFSRFTLETRVSLAAGTVMSVPFLTETLEDARLTIYRGGSGDPYPMIAIEFENPLPLRLPAGIVTLYESGRGHAGDAMIPELAPGAHEVIEFARDTAIRIRESTEEEARLISARIVDGVLVSVEQIERRTIYRIEGAPAADRRLTLFHPLRPGWQIAGDDGDQHLDEIRVHVDVPAGQIVTEEVVETRDIAQEVALLPMDGNMLGFWSSRVPDPELANTLAQMQALRTEEADLKREVARLAAQEAELVADQDRLAALIVQLGDDSAATSIRRTRVDEIDAEIDQLRIARREAEAQLDEINNTLRALIAPR